LKSDKPTTIFVILIFLCGTAFSQQNYPQNYFMFPIKPGQVNYLSGGMGELRPNHFHGGIDIKTDGKIGLKIYASAEGYVSRIKISSFGYGNALYITHPNGYVTVYAHLEKFKNEIADYVLKNQYMKENFDIELFPEKTELPIKKGEVIGLSGNSGSSGGPHLHYEIRDTRDRLFHPLLFGFKEVKDTIAPTFDRINIRTFTIDSRVDNLFGLSEYKPIKSGGVYKLPATVSVNGTIGIQIKAFDQANNNSNRYGITYYKLFLDNNEIFSHDIRTVTFDENKYINVHIDYETYMKRGIRFEKCYISDGDKLSTYKADQNRGKIILQDDKPHQVMIKIFDVFNNSSTLIFNIKRETPKSSVAFPKQNLIESLSYELFENIVKITAKVPDGTEAKVYKGNIVSAKIPAAYRTSGAGIYLYDLRKELPDSIMIGTLTKRFSFVRTVPSGVDLNFRIGEMEMSIPANALFDTLYLSMQKSILPGPVGQEVLSMNSASDVFFDYIRLNWVPELHYDESNTRIYSLNYNNKIDDYVGGEWEANKIKFSTRNLGKFTLWKDTVAPAISYKSFLGNSIRFNISDNSSGIGSIKASINGNWVLMNYDHKRNLIWSERIDKTVPLKGDFKLEVQDKVGNKSIYEIKL
jgi:murein DD-endopeptidase MepM/ murein hydrolase activator NlpD